MGGGGGAWPEGVERGRPHSRAESRPVPATRRSRKRGPSATRRRRHERLRPQRQHGRALQVLPHLRLHPAAPEEGLRQLRPLHVRGGRRRLRQRGDPPGAAQPPDRPGLPGADDLADVHAAQRGDGAEEAGDAGWLRLPHRCQPGPAAGDVHRHQPQHPAHRLPGHGRDLHLLHAECALRPAP